jgi:hypothetical protein
MGRVFVSTVIKRAVSVIPFQQVGILEGVVFNGSAGPKRHGPF